ncbi:MAG: D-alanyl-D-alanine dipeptidase, partial [Cyanobacteria bacterium J06635_1]
QRAGFGQHPNEWWHFSYGDQLWAWLLRKSHPQAARYGAIEDE